MKNPSLRRGLRFLVALAFCVTAFFAVKAADPAPTSPVSNVTFAQRTDGSKLVDVRYTLTGGSAGIALALSVDGGTTYSALSSLTGDVGAMVSAGTSKQIVWNAGTDSPNTSFANVKFRVTPLLSGAGGSFAPIPGGTYSMGNLVGDADITHAGTVSVTLSPYSMAVNDTTKAQWDAVRTWASANGYTDLATGAGKAANHPVHTVNWYDVIKWANAASEKDGLTPCYQVGGSVVRTGTSAAVICDWKASGYRLPTDAEWEVAARGGLKGKRFPWGDTISQSSANYKASTIYPYDASGSVNDFHPAYKDGGMPYTSPVGSFTANGYGLCDMAGNVYQWCWDFYGTSHSGGVDPQGPATGPDRVLRGGAWNDSAFSSRTADRRDNVPLNAFNNLGFRLARGRSDGSGSAAVSPLGALDTTPFQPTSPVSNVTFAQRTDGSKLVDVRYTLTGGSAGIALALSVDGGTTYSALSSVTGDVGATVSAGTSKQIVWNAGTDSPNTSFANVKFRITPLLSGAGGSFAPIPGGTYSMGNLVGDADITDAGTVSVTLSPYSMSVHDTTKAQWDAVHSWATSNGYSFTGAGSAKASNHPVVTESWDDVVKWANAASEQDALTPCYKVGGAVYRTGVSGAVTCDWNASGYRLPTEAEWEVAARGGLSGKRFPWGDTISHSQANYVARGGYPVDLSGSIIDPWHYHPVYAAGAFPYTSPVGSFAANGYGLHDMAGNVLQWCWDWYGRAYSPEIDPKGASTGWTRVLRGGRWSSDATDARCAMRVTPTPSGMGNPYHGFRLARGRSSGGGSWTESGAGLVDTTPPALTGVPVSASATSASGASVTFGADTATDNLGMPTVTYSPASGSLFPIGTSTVTVIATDGAGNMSSGTFSVTVRDTTAPVLTLPSNATAQATGAGGAMVNYVAATATDIVTASPSIGYSQASGTVFPLGTTTVTVSATDGAGNVSTETFTVAVNDTTAPALTLPPNVTAQATSAAGATVNYAAATATDTVTASPMIRYSQASGTVFPLGTNTVTVSATDGAGNVSTGTFAVTVNDTTAPVLTLPSNLTVNATTTGGVVVNYPAASAVDAVSASPVITYSFASGEFFPLGTTTVRVTAKDAADNTSTGTFTVTVKEAASLSFSAAEYPCIKGPTEVMVPVTVRRLNDSAKAVVVEVTPSSDLLQSGNYSLPASPMVLRWGAGDGSDRTFPVVVRAGRTAAGASIRLNLRNLEGAEVGDIGSAMVVLNQRDPGILMFGDARLERAKPATGDLAVNLVVRRVQGSTGAVSADVVVAGGTARPGDFTVANPVRLEWADGDTADKVFPVVVRESAAVPAAGKTIQFRLQNLSGGVTEGGVSSTTLVVFSSTMPGTLNFSSPTYEAVKAPTGDTLVPITVNREQGGKGAVKVQVASRAGSASADVDFALPSSPVTLNWADNELGPKTFNVVLKETAQIASGGETVLFRLQTVEGGAEVGRVSACTVTFSASDSLVPVLVVESPANRATVTGESVLFKGTATDASGVTRVEVTLNSEDPEEAVLMAPRDGKTFRWMATRAPEQGVNTVQVQAFDGSGNASAKLSHQFTFRHARPALAGTFDGRLEAATDKVQLAVEESEGLVSQFVQTQGEGLLTATVSVTGAFTGKLTTGGASVAFKGVLRRDGVAWFDSNKDSLEVSKGQGAGRVVLGNLSLRAQETGELPRLVGELVSDTATFGTVSAEKFVYRPARVLPAGMQRVPVEILDPASENGRYTALFESRVDEGTETNGGLERTQFPQSSGYARVVVASSGVVSVTGRLADGTSVSYSNRLSPSGAFPVYVPLYTGRGFLAGTPVFDASQPDTDLAGAQLRWVRPSGLTAPFAAGWQNGITLNLVGSKYVAVTKPTRTVPVPANPYTVFGPELAVTALVGDAVPDFVGLRVEMAAGGLEAGTTDEGQLSPGNVFKVTAPGAVGLKLVFTTLDGGFTGSFKHPLGSLQPIAGVVLQKTRRAAGGFVFLPPKGSKAPAAAGSVEATVP